MSPPAYGTVRVASNAVVAVAAVALIGYVMSVPIGQGAEAVWVTCAVLAWCISLAYARSGWWRNAFGRAFMFRNTAIAVLMTWVSLRTLDVVTASWSQRATVVLTAVVTVAFLNFLLTLTRRQLEVRHVWDGPEGTPLDGDR